MIRIKYNRAGIVLEAYCIPQGMCPISAEFWARFDEANLSIYPPATPFCTP